jgi:hypothetical protein
MNKLVRQKRNVQEAIDWLMGQCLTPKDEAPPRCELGRQSLGRRAVTCSACTWAVKEDELHEEIGSLIKRAAFQYAHTCPLYVADRLANKHICRAARRTVSLCRPFGG